MVTLFSKMVPSLLKMVILFSMMPWFFKIVSTWYSGFSDMVLCFLKMELLSKMVTCRFSSNAPVFLNMEVLKLEIVYFLNWSYYHAEVWIRMSFPT